MTSINVRDERETDVDAIRAITELAFRDVPQSRQTESAIIDGLREAGALTLSLVAVDEAGQVVGHVAVSPISLDGNAAVGWYGGGPLSVRPDLQRRGIGSALVDAAATRLREMGAQGCVIVGDPNYYGRLGIASGAPSLTVAGVPPENVLVAPLQSDAIPTGTVAFHPAFDARPDALSA
ncbi:GNAT family N-acetyltransferase [Mycolicibacterium lacusdiani]|uniref:GNAT family N-acetyltransferase n=1 Tax=Mycolicibacterium lacusdiani TaxID=2895283 RepID=UPI001F3CCC5F|nr:N-acetyltransferase [Mycolicibacterium lacusdiani]